MDAEHGEAVGGGDCAGRAILHASDRQVEFVLGADVFIDEGFELRAHLNIEPE